MTELVTQRKATAVVPSRHGPVAQLLIAWSPLSGILIAYAIAQWVNATLADRATG